ncbi:hypothetical protein DQ237_15225 [Blastococcus sp. TF02-8]|nr:hypothetical protein DQ237_15225 [Blastococcus sp. TF02-8]
MLAHSHSVLPMRIAASRPRAGMAVRFQVFRLQPVEPVVADARMQMQPHGAPVSWRGPCAPAMLFSQWPSHSPTEGARPAASPVPASRLASRARTLVTTSPRLAPETGRRSRRPFSYLPIDTKPCHSASW